MHRGVGLLTCFYGVFVLCFPDHQAGRLRFLLFSNRLLSLDVYKRQSVTNVGIKPTIGHYHKNVETHIFNFDKELYGKKIIVEFLKKTRDEVKFDSIDELSEQIVRDCREAREFHDKIEEKIEK